MRSTRLRLALLASFAAAAVATVAAQTSTGAGAAPQGNDPFRFKSGVELVNVTATVSDDDGHFVSGLTKDDFIVYEDGAPQEVTNFSNERVPVSLGILLDTSGSMTPDKMGSARSAINRFAYDLLDKDDELFFMQFASVPDLLQGWTYDRRAISRALGEVSAEGGTAMYDAIARALPIAGDGRNQKKAILVISDGNDNQSRTTVGDLRNRIRESEVMVYALGVDGTETSSNYQPTPRRPNTPRIPIPIPGGRGGFPGGGRFPLRPELLPQIQFPPPFGGGGNGRTFGRGGDEHVNEGALRSITDDTGGRTEIVRGFGDLDAATAHIADELSKQYYLGYNSAGKRDGRWHDIKVELKNRRLHVRARRGYVAS
jgi:Ca-activated chloride channel family protein